MKKTLCIILSALMLFCVSCTNQKSTAPENPKTEQSAPEKDTEKNSEKTISLYFADSLATSLVKEERKIPADEYSSLEEAVVCELIKGSEKENNVSLMPDGTRLLGVSSEDDVCTVNLSSEFIDNSAGGTAFETLSVYSVVNSLCELENVEKVKFLIDGNSVEVYGNFIFDEPFEPQE